MSTKQLEGVLVNLMTFLIIIASILLTQFMGEKRKANNFKMLLQQGVFVLPCLCYSRGHSEFLTADGIERGLIRPFFCW